MAISAYVGVPGSGKSYEVVKSVLLPAYLAGRRIVTNIEGINIDNFEQYALSVKKANISDLGSIIHVSDSDVMQDDFFPFKTSDATIKTFCKAGDLIAIDELWRIWSSDSKIPENHRSFISEHRHFTDEKTGTSCDLVVMNQSISNIPRFLKDRIENTYQMHKHKALGLPSRYRVDVFRGTKLFKSNKITSYQEKYQKAIFDLYKSYDGVNGQESTTDKRQNIFTKKSVWFFLVFLFIAFFSGLYFTVSFFRSTNHKRPQTTLNHSELKPVIQDTQLIKEPEIPKLSSEWRIAGSIKQNGKSFVILMSNKNAVKLEPASNFIFSGLMIQGTINGEIITRYTGGTAQ